MRIIGLFFPALISVSIKHSRNPEYTWQFPQILVEYGIYVLVNVLLTTVAVTYVMNVPGVIVDALDSFPFFIKYMVIAVLAAVFVPYIEEMIRKYIHITFTVRTKDDKGENHTKGH